MDISKALPYWAKRQNPIVRYQTRRARPARRLVRFARSAWFVSAAFLFSTLITPLAIYLVYVTTTPIAYRDGRDVWGIFLFGGYLGLHVTLFAGGWIASLIGATIGATLIAVEKQARTWDTLATTPFGTREIVYAKFSVGLRRMRAWLLPYLGVCVVISIAPPLVLVFADMFLPQDVYDYLFGFNSTLTEITADYNLPTLGVVWFFSSAALLLQPLLEATVNVSLGLLASAIAGRRVGIALALALSLRVALWIASGLAALLAFKIIVVDWLYGALLHPGPHWLSKAATTAATSLTNVNDPLLTGLHWSESYYGTNAATGLWLAPLIYLAVLVFLAAQAWVFLRLTVAVLNRERAG